jgi:hypothetical protein
MQKKKDEEASRIERVLKAAEKLVRGKVSKFFRRFFRDFWWFISPPPRYEFLTFEICFELILILYGQVERMKEIRVNFILSSQIKMGIRFDFQHMKERRLSLHDNGRKQLQEGNVPEALDLLLAADKSLSQVSTDVLSSTDNYGLLCLDVAWCYFLTQNIEFLTDAAWRLQKAEQCFEKSYGPNQERLIALKGAAAPEMIVFVRLELLNMVVAFHQGNYARAKYFYGLAKGRVDSMYIQEEDTMPLVAMGFDPRECRIALRTCQKNFDQAAQWLMERREQKRQRKREEREKRVEERKQRRWGRTRTGNWVNLDALKEFVDMGFEEALAAEALKQSDNSRDAALTALLNQSEVLRMAAEPNFAPDENQLSYLESMGFTRQQAEAALKQAAGVLDQAVSNLLASADMPDAQNPGDETAIVDALTSAAKQLGAALPDLPPAAEPAVETEEQKRFRELEEEAEREVIGGLGDEEAHLDVNLEREVSVLHLYEGLLTGK